MLPHTLRGYEKVYDSYNEVLGSPVDSKAGQKLLEKAGTGDWLRMFMMVRKRGSMESNVGLHEIISSQPAHMWG